MIRQKRLLEAANVSFLTFKAKKGKVYFAAKCSKNYTIKADPHLVSAKGAAAELHQRETTEMRKFLAPEFIYGNGARCLVGRYAKNLGGRKVLIVTDPGIIAAGWINDIIISLQDAGINCTIFSKVSQNPTLDEVMDGAAFYRDEHCNLIIAVGGGSAIDCAKGIGIVVSNRRHIEDFIGIDRVLVPMPPLICVPTTAGSGAEVSQFAVLRDVSRKIKTAVVSKAVVPDIALIDFSMLATLPPYVAACTGFDALVHAIEAYVSNASSPITDLHALRAIDLIAANIVPVIQNPADMAAWDGIMQGSLEAGLAFSNAILGAVHATGHSIGGRYNLVHGECNAVLLGHVMLYNYEVVPERFNRVGKIMGLDLDGKTKLQKKMALFDHITALRKTVGLGKTLNELGVSRSDIPVLAELTMQDLCILTNPRRPTQRDIEVIFEDAF